jgi:hypothetical protein
MGNECLHGLTGGSPPDKGSAKILRVQCAEVEGRPQQRKARGKHPPGEFVELFDQGRNLPGRPPELLDDRIDRVMPWARGRRPLHHLAWRKILRIDADLWIPIYVGH